MLIKIPIQLTNTSGIASSNEPVSLGVPLPKGKVFGLGELLLQDSSGKSIRSHKTTMALWTDGSIKWFLLDFQFDLVANSRCQVLLVSSNDVARNGIHGFDRKELVINDSAQNIIVDTGSANFIINKNRLRPFEQVTVKGIEQLDSDSSRIELIDEQGRISESTITSIEYGDEDNLFRRIVKLQGAFLGQDDQQLAEFTLIMTFYAGKATVKYDFTLLNPRAAEHKGGVWDLGDKGSLLFRGLSASLRLAGRDKDFEVSVKETYDASWKAFEADRFQIYQDSSGGENWKSYNHVNRNGDVPVSFKGYKCFQRGKQIGSGNKAAPLINLNSAATSVSVTAYICNFWQNFPKAIETNKFALRLKLFPDQFSDMFELQGGEQKSHTLFLDFSNDQSALNWCAEPVRAIIPLEYYASSKVIPYLAPCYEETAIQKLISRGIKGKNSFFEKRETIDEYGWRSYGDIFADHEDLEYRGNRPLISHYNNQYDALYGIIRQYVQTGNKSWYELLTALAQHIVDIDIYHTSEDRDEYNNGLFWHTDHYVHAHTSSHRTISIHQAEEHHIAHELGGGPGSAEHCYTTGLAFSYFMTGSSTFKEAAMNLVGWVTLIMEGSGTVLERIQKFRNEDIPVIKRLLSGKKVQKYDYPFTRATGNYITALIDAYSLTGINDYLLKAGNVIRQSIHPCDDISLRNLDDIEAGWSYLILLQAIGKYLGVKVQNDETDEPYLYARDSLIHYADWMLEHEYPFLEKPERLDYPNHTWSAQDLRKAHILLVASDYNSDNKDNYIKKARYFVEYIAKELGQEETRYYSRILIILMQNDIHESSLGNSSDNQKNHLKANISYGLPSHYSIHNILFTFMKDLVARIINISISREKRWLSFRLKS